jgi:hypothetical protein
LSLLVLLIVLGQVPISYDGVTDAECFPRIVRDLFTAAGPTGSWIGWRGFGRDELPRNALLQLTATVIAVFGHL